MTTTISAINRTKTPAREETTMSARLDTPEVKKNKIIFFDSQDKGFILEHDNGALMDNYTVSANIKRTMSLMTIFNKFFDEKSRKVPAQKIFDIGTEIETKFPALKGGKVATIDWNQFLRNALSDMRNPDSDGGADITEKEICDYYKRCAKIVPIANNYFSLKEK